MEQRLWRYMNGHPSEIAQWIQEDTTDIQMILTELLLLLDMFQIIDRPLMDRMNLIYSLLIDSTTLHDIMEKQLITFIGECKQKIDDVMLII
jgi:hypothetical protein